MKKLFAILCGVALLGDAAVAQQVVGGMIVPDGQVVTGPVFRRNGTSVPSITTGADANSYIFSTPPTASFLPNSPAAVVLTSVPTLYARVYTQGITSPVGGFIAPSNTIRGLDVHQIRDVLALPFLPDSLTLVQVPAGTCILFGTAAPITGTFPANPPAIPTPGPWGNGGVLQGNLIGLTGSPNCQNAAFVPAANYMNRQSINGTALAYRPNAGTGNTYAVAAALDVGVFPAQFSDMDTVYTSLDLLNYGSSDALRAALKQLDGESYADFGYLRMMAGRAFLDVLHQQMRAARLRRPSAPTAAEPALSLAEPSPTQTEIGDLRKSLATAGGGSRRTEAGGLWFAPYGAVGAVYGDSATHSASYGLHGFAAGGDIEIFDAFRIGGALGYSSTGLSTSLAASGSNEAFSLAAYASYAPRPWYLDAAAGYAYNWGSLTRTIAFPGIFRTAQGNLTASQFIGSVESGIAFTVAPRLVVTPFARLEVTAASQNPFTETGAGAISLAAAAQNTTGVRSIIGMELSGSLALMGAQPLSMALRLGWAHDYADLSGALNANFVGKPDTSFVVYGPTPDRNAATIGAGLTLPLPLGQAFLNYDGNLAQGYTYHAATLGLRIAF
ncbi:MAG: autotransporter outer membrane beta-barrel domain-containing protein [Reyranella sp.]|uniref:autotransporter outer membrane beta-barrel domain-containing protein n=1 Tax=Reyranella sp. TaxID=1929291 RepID=UPI003D0EBBD3